MAYPENCENWIDCDEKRKSLTIEMLFKLLFAKDANDCPAIRVTGITSEVTPGADIPTNAETAEEFYSLGSNALNYAAFQAWKGSNLSLKVLSIVNMPDEGSGSPSLIISHTV